MHLNWQALNKPGTECRRWERRLRALHFQSTVTAQPAGQAPFELRYASECPADWGGRRGDLRVDGQRSLHLRHNGQGEWRDGQGQLLPAFAGCYELDIPTTPCTNTLPIRRLRLAANQPARVVSVLYSKAPDLTRAVHPQSYQWLATDGDTSRIQYQNLTTGYATGLLVDAAGFVRTHPALFQRL